MIITFTNVIGAIRNVISSVITTNLKMWLGFETSETLGRELNDLTWVANVGWSINGDIASNDGGGSTLANDILELGKTYQFKCKLSSYTSGDFRLMLGSASTTTTISSTFSSTDEFTFIGVCAGDTSARVQSLNGGIGSLSISSLSIKELTQITPDKSGNNNVGELFTGKALEFNGVGDNVDIDFTTPVKSAVFWFKPLDTGLENIMWFGGAFAGTKSIKSSGNVIQTSGLSSVSIYVNGVQTTSVPLNQWSRVVVNFASVTPSELKFGYAFNSYGYIQLSNVQLYNENLSTDDIAYDYANPNKLAIDNPSTSLSVTNLKGYWALSEGDGLVAYDSGTNLEEEEVQNGTFNLGSEEVVNGDFSDGETGWLIQDGWSVTDNKLNVNTDDGNQFARQNSILEVGKTYVLTLDVSLDVGEIKFESGGTPNFIITTSDTTISHTFVATLTDVIFRRNVIPTRGYIDNISVKEVPNWVVGDKWTIANNAARLVSNNTDSSFLQQNSVFEIGKTYNLTFDATVVSGTAKFIDASGGTKLEINQTKTYNFTFEADRTDFRINRKSTISDITISNISVREVTASDHGGILNGATYVDAQPRIPQLGMMNWSKGSNLYSFSEDFENSDWNKNTGTTITNNYATSPNGDLTAARYVGTGFSGIYDTFTLTTNSYTLSFYVKSNTGQNQNCRLILDSVVSSNILVTTDWARISYTQNGSGNPGRTNGIFRDAGNSDVDILIWGAQLEESSSAGAYRLTDGGATLNSTVIPNPTIPTQDIFGNAVRYRLNSFNLDGSGYAEVADDADLDFGTGAFSCDGWVKFKYVNTSSINCIYTNGGQVDVANNFGIGVTSNKIVARVSSTPLNSSTTFSEVEWVYFALTRDGSGACKLYINGNTTPEATAINSNSVSNSLSKQIGKDSSSVRHYNDLISDVRLYDRALTSDEVENNYNAGLSAHTN